MAGRCSGTKTTVKGLVVLKVDSERNLLVVKGSVPGKPGALLACPAVRVGAKATVEEGLNHELRHPDWQGKEAARPPRSESGQGDFGC